jgi:hypothetical protein
VRRVSRAVRSLIAGSTALVASFGLLASAAAASSGPPYTDSSAVGYIGLCNQAGQQVTSGNVDAMPFAWRAVSTAPAQAPYNNASRTATLYAYQPQQGLAPGEWSGAQLTSSAHYTNPADPMAAATARDSSLEDFIDQYPPKWDGFLQLRMYLGAANEEQFVLNYPALDIKVTGDTWSAGGGTVNCDSGSAESLESIVLPPTTTSPTRSNGAPSGTTTGSGAHPSGGQNGSDGTAGSNSHPNGSDGTSTDPGTRLSADSANSSRTASHAPLVIGVIAAVLVLLALSRYFFVRRRRGPALGSSGSGITHDSSTKGH